MQIKNSSPDKSCIIIGGGLAGLICAIQLNRAGFPVTLVEKKSYPFHRVCGEYISNEVLPFLSSLDISLNQFNPSCIQQLALSSVSGKRLRTKLDLGGFGLSRYNFDNYLYEKAAADGVNFVLNKKVNTVTYADDEFECQLDDGQILAARYVIGAYGKRSNLDRCRSFFYKRSPYMGVKYHIKTDFAHDLVQLDNFPGGYCGTVKIEEDRFCLCYLSRTENLKNCGTIAEMESNILGKNPFLKYLFSNSDFVNNKPEVINEISFSRKTLVEDHVLYCGDSAGMISPLCGNGMAMAIHSAKILAGTLIAYHGKGRHLIEKNYMKTWTGHFSTRLRTGRLVQRFFGSELASSLAISCLNNLKPVSNLVIKNTHGTPF